LRASSRSGLLASLGRLESLVGWTPLRCFRLWGLELCVKLEYANPTGSHKDRAVVSMLRSLAEEGLLEPGGCVAEISSGNTGAALAWAAGLLGLRAVLYVDRGVSPLKLSLIRALGGEVVEYGVTPEDRAAAVEDMERRGCVYLDQAGSEANWRAHYEGTGREIIHQMHGRVDAFVMGAGTGATLTGVGSRLREDLGSPLVVGVTPRGSRVAGGPGVDVIEGLATHNVPSLLQAHRRVVDLVLEVSSEEALEGVAALLRSTGVAAGHSTGAAVAAVRRLAEEGRLEPGSRVVIVAADHLSRYPAIMERLASAASRGV
jgi:cysteine synthase A